MTIENAIYGFTINKDSPIKVISREEYARLLAQGVHFTNASLYEPDHAPKGTVFVLADLGPGVGKVLKRIRGQS